MIYKLKSGWDALPFFKSPFFIIIALCIIIDLVILWLPSRINTVAVITNKGTEYVRTTKCDPAEILSDLGVKLDKGDKLSFSGYYNKSGLYNNYAEITVESFFPVYIKADNATYHVTMKGGTVADALKKAGITVSNTDILSKSPQTILSPGEEINITRVDYVTKIEEEPIPRGAVYKDTSLIKTGRSRLLASGTDGIKVLTYEEKFVNGVGEEMKLVSEDVAKAPVDDTYLYGAGTAISPLDFGIELDENGRPTKYKTVLTNQKATGYSARYGAGTASGLHKAAVGYVAVDPRRIPYGTKMYILSHSGGYFLYGCAIAADTGTGLMDGIVDVDLFYDSYYESVLNGLRYVDIYILE